MYFTNMKKLSEETLKIIEKGRVEIENDEGHTLQQVKEESDSYSKYIHDKADKDREEHISLEEYGRSRSLE